MSPTEQVSDEIFEIFTAAVLPGAIMQLQGFEKDGTPIIYNSIDYSEKKYEQYRYEMLMGVLVSPHSNPNDFRRVIVRYEEMFDDDDIEALLESADSNIQQVMDEFREDRREYIEQTAN